MNKRFSERIGVRVPAKIMQLDGMSQELRNSLWNVVHYTYDHRSLSNWVKLNKVSAFYFFRRPVDEVSSDDYREMRYIKNTFFGMDWATAYDFIEFAGAGVEEIIGNSSISSIEFQELANSVLESECSGYRFIEGRLAPITTSAEMAEISEALESSSNSDMLGAHKHLDAALGFLAKRPTPDYRNSIKESISAVESIARLLGKEDAPGLSNALKELAKKTSIHGSLQAGFNSLYGYTSDEDGIRHAILRDGEVGFDEAKYMLVACSAFVNFLIGKARSTGLLVRP